MRTIAITDEMETRLEDIARHLNMGKDEIMETALSIFEAVFKEKKQKDMELEIAIESMKKASDEVRRSNTRLERRAKSIEEAKIDVFEVVSHRWGIEL